MRNPVLKRATVQKTSRRGFGPPAGRPRRSGGNVAMLSSACAKYGIRRIAGDSSAAIRGAAELWRRRHMRRTPELCRAMKPLKSDIEANLPGGSTKQSSAGLASREVRHWWHVRGALWVALLGVCSIGTAISFHPDVRAAARTSVIKPLAACARTAAAWNAWPPLSISAAAGAIAAAMLRRGKDRWSSSRPIRAG